MPLHFLYTNPYTPFSCPVRGISPGTVPAAAVKSIHLWTVAAPSCAGHHSFAVDKRRSRSDDGVTSPTPEQNRTMLTLFLDTSASSVGIALTRDGNLLAESLVNGGGRLQNCRLLPELERLLIMSDLRAADIDLFACCTGPGSFTGIRTAVATVQGLALATDAPCIGISSLAHLAMNAPHASLPVCPLLDARKNEVYAGLYRCNGLPEPLREDQAIVPELLLSSLEGPTLFLGDGARRYRDLIVSHLGERAVFAPDCHHLPRPAAGALLAEAAFRKHGGIAPENLLPSYLRLSEAELSRQQKRGAALDT